MSFSEIKEAVLIEVPQGPRGELSLYILTELNLKTLDQTTELNQTIMIVSCNRLSSSFLSVRLSVCVFVCLIAFILPWYIDTVYRYELCQVFVCCYALCCR